MESNEQKKQDQIFDLMKENKVNESIQYILEDKLNPIDSLDANGTTPLQYVISVLFVEFFFINNKKKQNEIYKFFFFFFLN